MILLIDNNDSFTFNLVELIRSLNAQCDVVKVGTLNTVVWDNYSHIIISPGPDVPSKYPQLFTMLEHYHQHKAILGVCLGHQVMGEFFGATLYNIEHVRHGERKKVHQIAPNRLLQHLPTTFEVGLYHSWALVHDSLNNTPLKITALDEQGVVMAAEHHQLPLFSIQFHPESFMSEQGSIIMQNFLAVHRP